MADEAREPLTMQRVADRLGTRPMSLYSHVGNRDDLVQAAADLALGEWEVDLPVRAGWERQVRAWCFSLRDRIRSYPALVWQIAANGRSHPTVLENLALLIRSLRRAGVNGVALAELVRWIPQTVIGAIVLELARSDDLQDVGDEASAIYASIGELSEEARSEIMELMPHYSEQNLTDLFEYSIDRLIDGIRHVVNEEGKQ